MLHITSGDISLRLLRDAGVRGVMLPWRDSLHEGPVQADLTLEALAALRGDFLASCGWVERDVALHNFRERNQALRNCHEHAEVVLWFDEDYYSQLQLMQLLAWFHAQSGPGPQLTQVSLGPRLEWHTAVELQLMFAHRALLSEPELAFGAAAWAAYGDRSPERLLRLLQRAEPVLPALQAALWRQLKQLPAVGSGLSLTEAHALRLVDSGVESPADLFFSVQSAEESDYMGDWAFWRHLAGMFEPGAALLKTASAEAFTYPPLRPHDQAFLCQKLQLTALGEAVLDGQQDWQQHSHINRDVGGVQLRAELPLWRWDGAAVQLDKRGGGSCETGRVRKRELADAATHDMRVAASA